MDEQPTQNPAPTPVTPPPLPPEQPVPPMPQQPLPPTPAPPAQPPLPGQVQVPGQMPLPPAPAPPNSRSKLLAIGVVIVVLIAVGVAVFALDKSHKPKPTTSTSNTTSQANSDSSGASTQTDADNAERLSDVHSLQTQLEAYFSQYGSYPSLTDMNNASWRSEKMPSLDPKAMVDPSTPNAAAKLVSKPTKGAFSYQVSSSDGKSCEADDTQCAQFTLTTTYEGIYNGQTSYSVKNLD